MPRNSACWLLLGCGVAAPAFAADPPVTLERVEVTVRVQGVDPFELPASLDSVVLDGDAQRAVGDVSAVLGAVPGVLARDRRNLAQDTQLSIRGFGARSTFGVRGLRLLTDGIPATMPDGQGQLSNFALAGAQRIEILRGPFSALYGNSAGGVVQLFSADGEAPASVRLSATGGSAGLRLLDARWLGKRDDLAYALSASRFATDGERAHSRARRDVVNAKFGWRPGDGRELDLIVNALDLPEAQDPLGLDAAQLRADPRQVTPQALQYDTRKSVRQQQLGLVWRQALGATQNVRLMGYFGARDVVQYQSVPVAAQANPLSGGGVVDLDNGYGGVDARWSLDTALAGRALQLTVGANADRQRQHRRGYENFVGGTLGVRGALRRDERDTVGNDDVYAQAWWRMAPRWSLLAGLRHSRVAFRSHDDYITASNPDDSGHVRDADTTPVAGLSFAASERVRLHASFGTGFETPTFNELAYRADGGPGLALDLQPAHSRNLELGAKWRGAYGARIEAALFRADTDDELAVASNVGGRSTYRNVGRARRQGGELGGWLPLGSDWSVQLAATWLDARFRDGFLACSGAGCSVPNTSVAAGARVPGTVRRQGYARLQWQPGDWLLAAEAVGVGATTVNDSGSQHAAGYGLLHLEAARRWDTAHGALRAWLRIDNLLDRAYVGSVIVNEGSGRYYEPGPGRGVQLGLRWDWRAAE